MRPALLGAGAAVCVWLSGSDPLHCEIKKIDIRRSDGRVKKKGGYTMTPIQYVVPPSPTLIALYFTLEFEL